MNYVDLIILAFVLLFGYIGYRRGLVKEVADLIVLLISFSFATLAFTAVGKFFSNMIAMPETFIKAGSFFFIWFLTELVLYILALIIIGRINEDIMDSKWNIWSGVVLGAIKSGALLVFVLITAMMLPLGNTVVNTLKSSFTGHLVESNTPKLEKIFERAFGEAAIAISKFATVKSDSNEKIDLGFTISTSTLSKSSATEMLNLVNIEREKVGLKELVMDTSLSKVAEDHGKEMFQKGYLSHFNLGGKSPFDRMNSAGISFFFAGENIALATDTSGAHTGLMNSAGHKANILSGDYKRVGIAVLDGGARGKIFVQEFTD